MATDSNAKSLLLDTLREQFAVKPPRTLEQRLESLTPTEMKSLLQSAQLLQVSMNIQTSFHNFEHDYASLLASMYPKMDPERRALITDFLDEVAPLTFEPQPKPKPDLLGAQLSVYDRWNEQESETAKRDAVPFDDKVPEPELDQSNFLDRLTMSESSGRSDAEITIADGRRFVGKLQMGEFRLKDYQAATGKSFTQDEFKADPALQDEVAQWHITDLDEAINALGDAAADYDRDGLRAVAHLGGKSGMKKFVLSKGKYDPADELGTSLQSYYDKFSNQS